MPSVSAIYSNKAALLSAVALSSSLGECLRRLGLSHTGNSRKRLRAAIAEHKADTSHVTADDPNRSRAFPEAKPLADHLVIGSLIGSTNLKEKLWAAGLLPKQCQICGIGAVWNGLPLVLQLDHINGNRRDNRLPNLRILCPNCHSQTHTFAGRALKKQQSSELGLKPRGGLRFGAGQAQPERVDKINWPSNQELAQLVWEQPLSTLSAKLGVSDTAIKKRCDKLGITRPPQGYWVSKERSAGFATATQ